MSLSQAQLSSVTSSREGDLHLREHLELFGVHMAQNPTLGLYSDLDTRLTHSERLHCIGNNKTFSALLWYRFLAQCAELSDYFPPAGLSFWLELLSIKSPYGSKQTLPF